ncbi:MAG TPA: sugar ABC transporter substrate-binding protein [Planctomycetes bacterium]|nr:sugar ABC transporter substrate-binding protein [Planctomycetota bacterium]
MTISLNNHVSQNDLPLLRRPGSRNSCLLAVLLLTSFSTGCTCINGVPVSRVPRELLQAERKNDFEDISLLRLRQDSPDVYRLAPGDVLGFHVFIRKDDELFPELAPVNFPEDGSLLPAIGSAVPVQEDGTIALPIVGPIQVEGLSRIDATERVRRAYTVDKQHFPIEVQFSLTMIRKRTVRVLVIREESGGLADISKRGTGTVLDLPAYENDVLHALSETGGMPGLDVQNEIMIYRGMYEDGVSSDQMLNHIALQNGQDCEDPCFCDESPQPDPPNVTRVPLRYHPSNPPQFTQQDIILEDGDIVIIRSRDKETYFTGGLLAGGEHALPRDKDLDIVGAVALAGGSLGSSGTGIGGIGNGGGGGVGGGGSGSGGGGGYIQPSQVILIRELPCGNAITMKIDLKEALQSPAGRVLIQPNDVILLRYTLPEEIGNVLLGMMQFNFLFNGFSGNGAGR